MSDIHIWDSHVHLFPPEIYRNWEKYAALDPCFAELTRKSDDQKKTEQAWVDYEEALAVADEAGVWGLCMQGWYWNDPGLMRMHNDYMAEAIGKHPDRLKAFVSVNPKFGWPALSEIERCAAMGFSGVGELGPGGCSYDFEDPDFLAVLEMAETLNLPVCIHCGENIGPEYRGKDVTPLTPLAEVIRSHPDLKLILAHLGGGLIFFENLRRYHGHFGNVRYDTAANPLLYNIGILKAAVSMAGADRVLFGSDFPLLLYPSKSRKADMAMFLEEIRRDAGLSEEEERKFLGEAFCSFLETDKNVFDMERSV